MPSIEVIGPEPIASDEKRPFASYGTRVLMDGKELDECRSVTITAAVDSVLTAKMEVNVTEFMRFKGNDVDVHISIVALPGFVIVEESTPDGAKQYRARRETPLEP